MSQRPGGDQGGDAGLARLYLDTAVRRLELHAGRVEDCLARLSPEHLWFREGEHENAPGNLVLHLCGNMRQWIGHGVGSMPDVRTRDAEFAAREGMDAAALAARLRAGVDEAIAVIRAVPEDGLERRIRVQNYELTVLEAIFHVVDHFSGHAAQIFFLTKNLTRADLGFYRHLSRPAHSERTP